MSASRGGGVREQPLKHTIIGTAAVSATIATSQIAPANLVQSDVMVNSMEHFCCDKLIRDHTVVRRNLGSVRVDFKVAPLLSQLVGTCLAVTSPCRRRHILVSRNLFLLQSTKNSHCKHPRALASQNKRVPSASQHSTGLPPV